METQWLAWARRLQAIAQTGLTYSTQHYDTERYEAVRGIAAEMMAAGSTPPIDAGTLVDFFSREAGYATPKVDVRAAVFENDRILLVREREDGLWTLPGGWADVGDSPSFAAVRETKEESGYEVVARKLAAVLDRNRHGHPPIPYHAYKLFFLCDLTGGAAAASYETLEVGFFAENELPPLSLTRVTAAQIAHLFEHYRHPEWPTSFD
jgi:ADP-ribose pyrophosphatase YjhB (NUDIX family)